MIFTVLIYELSLNRKRDNNYSLLFVCMYIGTLPAKTKRRMVGFMFLNSPINPCPHVEFDAYIRFFCCTKPFLKEDLEVVHINHQSIIPNRPVQNIKFDITCFFH